jgi:CBS domain-containing protein
MKIYDLMTSQPHVIAEDATIVTVAQSMQRLGCGIFPVENGGSINGVITDRDIINRVISKRLKPETTLVKEVMTKAVIFCYEDEAVARAIKLMNINRIRRILVLNDDYKLVGILSMIDIFRRLKDSSMLGSLFADTLYS